MKQDYEPRIAEAATDQIPLLPGLAERLKEKCCDDEPDVRYRHVTLDDAGAWQIDEHLEACLWYPNGPLQSCFYEVTEHRTSDDGTPRIIREYYQIEYYEIPSLIADFNREAIAEGHAWIVTQVNNVQLEEWLRANGVLDFSEDVIEEIKRDGKTLHYEHNSSMEQGKERTDN